MRKFFQRITGAFSLRRFTALSGVTGEEPGEIDAGPIEDYYGTNPWLHIAIKRFAQAAAMLPVVVHRGNSERPENGAAQRFLNNPNDTEPGMSVWLYVFSWLKLRGDAFLLYDFGDRNVPLSEPAPAGRPLSWYVLPANRMTPLVDRNDILGRVLGYEFAPAGSASPVRIDRSRILHIREFSPTSRTRGVGAGEALATSLALDAWAQRWNLEGFRKGGSHLRILFKVKYALANADVKNETLRMLKHKFTGRGSHEPILLDADSDAKPFGNTHQDMEFAQLRGMNREEIAAAVGVTPARIGLLEHSNFANMAQQDLIFWESEVLPSLALVEGFLTKHTLPMFGSGLEAKFDTSSVTILQDNIGDWIDYVKTLRDRAVITAATAVDILRAHGLPNLPYPPEKDRLLMPGSWVDAESIPDGSEPEPAKSMDEFLAEDAELSAEASADGERFFAGGGRNGSNGTGVRGQTGIRNRVVSSG